MINAARRSRTQSGSPLIHSSMETITAKQQQQIADLLSTMILPVGLGDKENACSIAAINLALTGKLTDKIPDCMSKVIGKFIIIAQDSMPSEMRNSAEWKRLLPLAAGTGRKCESERMIIVMQWMWETVLPTIQPFADENGFGSEWRVMLQQQTTHAATDAAAAAHAAAAHAAADAWRQFNPCGLLERLITAQQEQVDE